MLLPLPFQSIPTPISHEGVLALYKGATPPAVGWAAIDSLLLGSLHNYRLFFLRHGMTEPTPQTGIPRLTLMAHGVAGLFAGLTRLCAPKLPSNILLTSVWYQVPSSQHLSSFSKVNPD